MLDKMDDDRPAAAPRKCDEALGPPGAKDWDRATVRSINPTVSSCVAGCSQLIMGLPCAAETFEAEIRTSDRPSTAGDE